MRARSVALVLCGLVLGSLLLPSASAHFVERTGHLAKHVWNDYIKGQADARYVNVDEARSAFSAQRSLAGGQAVLNNTEVPVLFASEDFDSQSDFSPPTGLFTAPVAGVYSFTGHVSWTANATGFRQVFIEVLTATSISHIAFEGDDAASLNTRPMSQNVSAIVKLDAGHSVGLVVLQTSGGVLTAGSRFAGALLGG